MERTSIYSADLPERDKVVYLYLKERCGKKNECFPAMRTIAGDLGISRITVVRAINDLITNGYVSTVQRWRENGGRSTLIYRLKK